MGKASNEMIGTWPTPEIPIVSAFEERDKVLLRDLNSVFEKHGVRGKISRIEFDCGMEAPKPSARERCFRVCYPGPDDRPYCIWVCL